MTAILLLLSATVTGAISGTLTDEKDSIGVGTLGRGGVYIEADRWTRYELCGHSYYDLYGHEEETTIIWTNLAAITSPYEGWSSAETSAGSYSSFTMGPAGLETKSTSGSLLTASNGAVYMKAILAEWTLFSIYCHHKYFSREFDSGRDTSWVTDWTPLGGPEYIVDKALANQGTKSHKDIPTKFYWGGYSSHDVDLRFKAADVLYNTHGVEDPQGYMVEGVNKKYLRISVGISFGAKGVSFGTNVLSYESGIEEYEKYEYWFNPGNQWFIDRISGSQNMLWAFYYIDPSPPPPPPSCVWASTWNGSAYVDENNLLPQSQVRNYSSNLTMTDRYILQEQPAKDDGNYTIRFREFVEERDVIDRASLWAIYHGEDVDVATKPDGDVLTFTPNVASSALSAKNESSSDVLGLIASAGDNKSYEGETDDDYVNMTFAKAPYQATGWLVIRSKSLRPEKWQVPCYIPGPGTEHHCGDIPSRSNWFYEVLNIGSEIPFTSGTSFSVKLYLRPYQHLDYVTFQNQQAEPRLMYQIPLGQATDDNSTDVTTELTSVDKEYVYLIPGDNITAIFDGSLMPSPLHNETVDFLVQVDGFYMPAITMFDGEAGRILAEYDGENLVVMPYLYDYDGYVNVTWHWDNETHVSDVLRIEHLAAGEYEVLVTIRFATSKILLRTQVEIPD